MYMRPYARLYGELSTHMDSRSSEPPLWAQAEVVQVWPSGDFQVPMPQPRARRQAAMVVPVVITLSTKYTGKSCMGSLVRMMAFCSTVRPKRPRIRRRADDSTG